MLPRLMPGENPTPNSAIKDYIESDGPKEWRHFDTMKWLYGLHDTVLRVWFSPQNDEQLQLPQSVLAVSKLEYKTLAAYRLTHNPNGLPFEIVLNELWISRPKWELAESLTHETIHLYQEYMAGSKVEGFQTCAGNYHNKQFVGIAEEIGLHPKLGEGYHTRPADGQFERLMELLWIQKPDHAYKKPERDEATGYWWDGDRRKPKGESTLLLYENPTCPEPKPCKLRSGKKDLEIACLKCGGTFVHSH